MTESIEMQTGGLASAQLTPREYQVALLVARGLSNKEVARALGLSPGTIKVHVHNLFLKLRATNRYGVISKMGDWAASPRLAETLRLQNNGAVQCE